MTSEEQNRSEGNVAKGQDVLTVVSAEEQYMVENSSAYQGFVPQENGTGLYFVKENRYNMIYYERIN
ncbi:hypothetical protein ACFCYN_21365 [Gottfriedia sp. NPDC056225]|uniref:hypothetical protein n=1 Tax=Gottfriedia sp. NPDC056225 TaxID=3345751 RepID=UPI0035E124A5